MKLFHGAQRRRLSLFASGALDGAEHEAVLRHAAACAECRDDLARIESVLKIVAADPVHGAEPPLHSRALLTRVLARLDEPAPAPVMGWRPAWALGTLSLAATAALAVMLVSRGPAPETPVGPPAAESVAVSSDALERVERNVVRAQTVRYLSEAQDVLSTVAATHRDCLRETEGVDLTEEARRSRELLARRALFVEMDRDELAAARPVLDDVEGVLREVASLPSCVRRVEVAKVQEQMERRRLLMKIRLMTRELEG